MSDSENSSSGSNGTARTAASRGTTAKAKKNAERARMTARRANLASVRANLTEKFTKLPADLRAQAQAKLKEIRGDPDMDTAERAAAEEKYIAKVKRAVDRAVAAKEAEKQAKAAEAAAKREAAKSARAAATTARREEKERETARAMANLKEYLGKSPLKKYVENLYKKRKNTRNLTVKNYAKAVGLKREKNLTESQKKRRNFTAKAQKVVKDMEARGIEVDEFCNKAYQVKVLKRNLEEEHKAKGVKYSLSTVMDVCAPAPGMTPTPGSKNNSA